MQAALFFSRFLKSPKTVGSVAPSSRWLTEEMMKHIDWQHVRSVAELGAGTGVFTRALQERLHADARAVVFEQDAAMRRQLVRRHPALLFHGDARELTAALEQNRLGKVDAIVSGLPFANFEQTLRDEILDEIVDALQPGGTFVTFQYSLQMKAQLQARFSRVRIRFVARNLPCAFVYVCTK